MPSLGKTGKIAAGHVERACGRSQRSAKNLGIRLTRREFLASGLCLCCLPSAAMANAGGPFATEEVAEGIHIRRGAYEDATEANAGAIANIGFIIGREGVLVTDPGGSLIDGERLRATIAQTTGLPVKYVVMSHVHPDHVFGAAAFLADNPVFVGHARLKDTLEQRGAYYRGILSSLLGPERTGTIVFPSMEIRDRAEIDLGGRVIEATAHEPAHTVCDLSLLDKKTGTLLPADLLFVERAPALDGSLRGWLKTLDGLRKQASPRAVPGHGPAAVDWPAGSADLMRYLETLERETRKAVADGIGIESAIKTAAGSEREKWKLFGDYNSRNVAEAYRELEWE
jgi:quinoprotein relay system zinc metallohydrolase 2